MSAFNRRRWLGRFGFLRILSSAQGENLQNSSFSAEKIFQIGTVSLVRFTKRIGPFFLFKRASCRPEEFCLCCVTPPIFTSCVLISVKAAEGNRDVAITSLLEMARQLLQNLGPNPMAFKMQETKSHRAPTFCLGRDVLPAGTLRRGSSDRTLAALNIIDSRFIRLIAGSAILLMSIVGSIAGTMAVSRSAFAADYYVDSNAGNDAFTGTTPWRPWRTLSRVNHYKFQPGDIIHLGRGSMWREVLTPQGANDANFRGVTFEPYGTGANPVINGSDAVSGWIRSGGPVYAARESQKVYGAFVDGQPGWGLMHACCLGSSSCAPSPRKPPMRGETCVIGPMQPGSWYWSGPSPMPPAAPNTLYVWLPAGDDPASHLVEAVTRQIGIHGWVHSNQIDSLTIDGLQIIQTGLRGISLESEDRAGRVGIGKGISGLTIRNCIIERIGTGPFDDGSYGNAITIINATAPMVENNRLSYCGNHGNCINVQNANGARIIGNSVDHWNHNGIDVKGSEDVLVKGNSAIDQPRIGAAYYTEYSRNVTFEDNRARNVFSGFQISDDASARLLNNVVDLAGTGIYLGPHAISLNLSGNSFSHCPEEFEGDGSGTVSGDRPKNHFVSSLARSFGF